MTGPVDNRTPNYGLPLPDLSNFQDDDVQRIIAAFALIDMTMQAIADTVAAKAPMAHGHEMAQIIGLADALAAKMPAAWRPALSDITGVDVASAANGMVLKRVGANWIAANIQLGDVPGWQDTVNALIASAIAGTVGAAPAALDTLFELSAALGNDPAFASTVSAALGNRLRFDAAQGLSAGQKAQALGNLGVSPLIQALLDDTTETQALTTLGIGAGLRGLRTWATTAEIWTALKVTATTDATGVVRKATAADLTAGTADRFPDAAVLKPALVAAGPAAMVKFAGGSPPAIRAQRNVSAVARTGAGAYRVTFATQMKSADYVMSAALSYAAAQVSSCSIVATTADYVDVQCTAFNSALGGAFDPGQAHLIFHEA